MPGPVHASRISPPTEEAGDGAAPYQGRRVGRAASPRKGTEHEDGDRRRSRGGCLDRGAAEAARRVGRDRHPRAGPLRLVRELRPALPHRRGDPGAGQPAAADAGEPGARASRSTCGPDRRCSASTGDAKEVEVRDEKQGRTYRESYDKLVLCPGAEPIRPPIPGADDPRVDVLRNIPDMDRIIAQLERGRHQRRRRRRQLHRAGAHRGVPGARAADDRRRADRAADAVARPRDDPDPGLPRPHPRRGPAARHVGQGRSPDATDDRLVLDLSDGTSVEADVVVMAAGARPNVRPRP